MMVTAGFQNSSSSVLTSLFAVAIPLMMWRVVNHDARGVAFILDIKENQTIASHQKCDWENMLVENESMHCSYNYGLKIMLNIST